MNDAESMNDREIDAAVAELIGYDGAWLYHGTYSGGAMFSAAGRYKTKSAAEAAMPALGSCGTGGDPKHWTVANVCAHPMGISPSTDLNAIDSAVRAWATTAERKVAFMKAIVEVVNNPAKFDAGMWYLHYFDLTCATARRRCLALLSAARTSADEQGVGP